MPHIEGRKKRNTCIYCRFFAQTYGAKIRQGAYARVFRGSLKIPPHEDTILHRFLLQDGAYYGWYRGYTSALHVALMAWMLWAAWRFAAGRSLREGWQRLSLYLAVFGLWLSLMWWETNCRYFSNFALVIIACGVLAVSDLPGAARRCTP